MLRYQSGDDTMTEEDYHYLYYGYAYQDAYKPLNANSDMDKAMLIAQTVDFENPTHESLEKLISCGERCPGAGSVQPQTAEPAGIRLRSARRLEERTDQLQPDELHPGDDRGFRQRPQGRERLAYPDVRDMLSICWPHTTVTTVKHASSAARWNTSPCSSRYGPKRDGSRDITSITVVSTGTNPTATYSNVPRTWQFNNLRPREYK